MLREGDGNSNSGDVGAACAPAMVDTRCPIGSLWTSNSRRREPVPRWRVTGHEAGRIQLINMINGDTRSIMRQSLLVNYRRRATEESGTLAAVPLAGVCTDSMCVSPAIAERWLNERNPEGHNRTMSAAHIRSLADDILGGHWKMTHQGVCFDKHGLLKDGQHRLAACVLAGKSIWIRVTYAPGSPVAPEIVPGIPPANVLDFDIGGPIDCGRYRSPHVQLGLQADSRNFDDWKRIQSLVSAMDNIRGGRPRRLSAGYIETTYARMSDDFDWAVKMFPHKWSAPGPAALMLAHMHPKHREAVERFASIIVRQSFGDDPKRTAFRAYECMRIAGKGDTSARREKMKCILRLAMAFCRDEAIDKVYATDLGLDFFGVNVA